MQLRWNGSIQHGFQIPLDGGQRRSEVMRDIGNKFFLGILRSGNFACHIIQGSSEIADLIFTFYLKFVVHVSGSILLCCFRDFTQGKINHFRKENQDDQGEQEQNHQHQIRDI